jgi:uncharacterized HAD superfamily protein
MLPIYVDFDDVLADTTKSFLKILRCEFGKSVNFEDIFSFDLRASFDLSESEFEHFFQRVHQPEVIMEFAPIEGCAYEASLDWLSKHNVPYHSFMMVDKYSRENIDTKIAVSMEEFSEMKFSLAVEDSAKMALHLSQKMGISVALIDRPWNRRANLNHKINRYTSWYDIQNDFQTP